MTTTRIAGLMAGKTVLVTGATGGIGKATALGLARMGAHVAITGRHRGRTEAAAREIRAVGGQVDLFVADLSSQSQLRGLAAEVLDRPQDRCAGQQRRRVLERHVTEDGYERTFALNHLAPFLLTNLLLDRMQHSTAARVVTVSSNAHAMGRIDFENLQKGPTPGQGLQPVQARQRPLHLRAWTAARDHRHRQCAAPRRRAHRLRGRGSCQRPAVPHSRGSTLHEKPDPGRRDVHPRGVRPGTQTCQRTLLRKPHREESAERTYDQAVAAQLWRVSTKLVHLTDT